MSAETDAGAERREEERERRLERLRYLHASAIELTSATSAFEHAALAPPMLLNGGALVAFLALLGADSFKSIAADPLGAAATIAWLAGVTAAATATAFGFFSQRAFQMEVHRAIEANRAEFEGNVESAAEKTAERGRLGALGVCYRNLTKAAYLLSMVAFVLGTALAMIAVRSPGAPS